MEREAEVGIRTGKLDHRAEGGQFQMRARWFVEAGEGKVRPTIGDDGAEQGKTCEIR